MSKEVNWWHILVTPLIASLIGYGTFCFYQTVYSPLPIMVEVFIGMYCTAISMHLITDFKNKDAQND